VWNRVDQGNEKRKQGFQRHIGRYSSPRGRVAETFNVNVRRLKDEIWRRMIRFGPRPQDVIGCLRSVVGTYIQLSQMTCQCA
jgi:hypothetical protein